MRVMFLGTSARLGGAERVLLDMVAACAQRGTSSAVVLPEDGPLEGLLRDRGAEVLVIPFPPAFARLGEAGRSPFAAAGGLVRALPGLHAYRRRIARAIADWAPDVVHSNGIKMHVVGAHAGGPPRLIWHLHDYLSSRRISRTLLRAHASRVALVVAISEDVRRDAQRVLGPRRPIALLHNGIDTDHFAPEGEAAVLDAGPWPADAPEPITVGFVATYARWKGHDVFLRALASLPPALPVVGFVVGGPVYRTSAGQHAQRDLVAMVERLGVTDRVRFIPFAADPAPVYRALDIVVHASVLPEPFGLVVAEAMACGRAVIASDCGGVREIAAEGTSLLHDAGDVGGLARAIERLARDAGLRRALGARARARIVERFDRTRFATGLAALHAHVARPSVTAVPAVSDSCHE